MPIKGVSEVRRLPRLGKIRLGIKVQGDKKNPYPRAVDYFVVPEEIQPSVGEKPKKLSIMFPVEDEQVFFQQWYMRYGFGVLKCIGDGRNARTWDEKKNGFKSFDCPCEELEKRNCSRQGILQFLLYEVPGAGVWQIRTGSKNSIIDINSSIDYIRSMCERIRMIPLVLKREEMTTPRTEEGKLKSSTHHTLKIDLANTTLKQLLEYARVKPSQILLPSADLEEDGVHVRRTSAYRSRGHERETAESMSSALALQTSFVEGRIDTPPGTRMSDDPRAVSVRCLLP